MAGFGESPQRKRSRVRFLSTSNKVTPTTLAMQPQTEILETATNLTYHGLKQYQEKWGSMYYEEVFQQIDIFLENPIDFKKAFARKHIIRAAGIEVPLISTEHLKLIKRQSGRKQDLSDIEALERIFTPPRNRKIWNKFRHGDI
ncbi:MAG: hypothetical protein ABII96_07305 [Candidatus Zixiibacteriota bacterium]